MTRRWQTRKDAVITRTMTEVVLDGIVWDYVAQPGVAWGDVDDPDLLIIQPTTEHANQAFRSHLAAAGAKKVHRAVSWSRWTAPENVADAPAEWSVRHALLWHNGDEAHLERLLPACPDLISLAAAAERADAIPLAQVIKWGPWRQTYEPLPRDDWAGDRYREWSP